MPDLSFVGSSLLRVTGHLLVEVLLVGNWVEQIEIGLGLLLATEDEVDPLMQVFGNVVALKGFFVFDEEVFNGTSPLRQLSVADSLAILPHPQVDLKRVGEDIFSEKLWDELLHVA